METSSGLETTKVESIRSKTADWHQSATILIGMIGMGILSVISRDLAFDWQPIPAFHPGRKVLAVASGLIMVVASAALLFRATAALVVRTMLVYSIAWLSLKIPAVISVPQIEDHGESESLRSYRATTQNAQ
jgi:hypothetical protein